jgi:hypothetical protein
MGLFKGIGKIAHTVNPIEAGKPGARLIRDSVNKLTQKNKVGMEPVALMADDDRQFVVRQIKRSAIISFPLGFALACLALWSGLQQNSILIIISSVIIMTGSGVITYLKLWQADMVENNRSISLAQFTANLFHGKEKRS